MAWLLDLLLILSLAMLPLQPTVAAFAKPCPEKHASMDAGAAKVMGKDCKCAAGACSLGCAAACSASASCIVSTVGRDSCGRRVEAVPPLADTAVRSLIVAPELHPPRPAAS